MRYKKRQKQIEIDRKRNKKTERNYLKRQKEIKLSTIHFTIANRVACNLLNIEYLIGFYI